MTLAPAPALDADDLVPFGEHAEFDSTLDAPFQATVDGFLPVGSGEVGFGLGVEEGVDAAVEMGILWWLVLCQGEG